MARNGFTWVDLSGYGLRLVLKGLEGGRSLLALGGAETRPEAAGLLGFQAHTNKAGTTLYIRRPGLSFDDIRAVLPDAQLVGAGDTLADGSIATEATFFRAIAPTDIPGAPVQQTTRTVEPAAARPERGWSGVTPVYLGMNKLNFRVFRVGTDRVMQSDKGAQAFLSERGPAAAGLFLLAPADDAALDAAAEGFCLEMERENLRLMDLLRFTAAVYDVDVSALDAGDARVARCAAAVDRAQVRQLAGLAGKTMTDVFNAARRMTESRTYVASLPRLPAGVSAALPLPLAVALQRVIGAEELTDTQSLTVSGIHDAGVLTHLPRSVNVVLIDATPQDRAIIRSAMPGREFATAEAPSAFSISVLEKGRLDAPLAIDGVELTRSDLRELMESIDAREEMGRSVFVFSLGSADDAAEIEAMRRSIGRRYAIEGTMDVDGSLLTGVPGTPDHRVYIVGRRRPIALPEPHEAAMRLTRRSTWGDVWSWTAEVVANRAKIADYHAELEAKDGLDDAQRADADANTFQTPYVSASRAGTATTMVPRNLEGATRHALNRIVEEKGDVDAWVGNELAVDQENLAERWSPEQMDAIALCLHAFERDRTFLLGDQTGIGKGRVLAGIMRWAVLNGHKVVFATEGPVNFSDIWRDIVATGSEHEFSAMILNAGVNCVDHENNETLAASDALMVKALTHLQHWPDGTRVHAHILTAEAAARLQKKEVFTLGEDELPENVDAADVASSRSWAPNSNLVLVSYSQFNRPVAPKRRNRAANFRAHEKSLWLRQVVDDNTLFICDESHNAASGSSHTAEHFEYAKARARYCVDSSATWAKRVKNMAFYKRLFPKGFPTDNLTQVMARGGETMQETLSAMLARDGVMVRREHDLSRCEFDNLVDTKYRDRNHAIMDALAPVLAEMAFLSGDLDERVAHMNAVAMAEIRRRMGANAGEGQVRHAARNFLVSRVGFGSPLHTVSRLLMSALLADATSDSAIQDLQNGLKPVILLDSTVESLLAEMGREGGRAPDFRDVLTRVLDRMTNVNRGNRNLEIAQETPAVDLMEVMAERLMTRIPQEIQAADRATSTEENPRDVVLDMLRRVVADVTVARPDANPDDMATAVTGLQDIITRMPEEKAEFAQRFRLLMTMLPENPGKKVRRIREMIAALPQVPVSAIDYIRDRIESAGYSCGEITGRSLQVRDGKVEGRPVPRKVSVKNAFNRGELDALIINQAGSTGIDLHASPRFADKRRRSMLAHQVPEDVVKFVQALGRVNRFDQMYGPIVRLVSTGMPAEVRLLASLNTKLRRMSANTTSNRDNANLAREIPDLINSVGDRVVTQYLEGRPDLVRRLGLPEPEANDDGDVNADNIVEGRNNEEGIDVKRDANGFIARMSCLLSVEHQMQVLAEIEAEYIATIQELDARGANPLRTRSIDGTVVLVDRHVFSGVDVDDVNSEFDRPVYAETVNIQHAVEPIRSRAVIRAFERGLAEMGAETTHMRADRLERRRDDYLSMWIPPTCTTIEEAVANGAPGADVQLERFSRTVDGLRKLAPGSGITLNFNGSKEIGVVTNVFFPHRRGWEHFASGYDIEVVIPGETMPLRLTMHSLLNDPAFTANAGLNSDDSEVSDALLKAFDTAMEGTSKERRVLLTGNEWAAMTLAIEHKLGVMTTFVNAQGVRQRGVLVHKDKTHSLDFMPVALQDTRHAAAMASTTTIWGSSTLDPLGVRIDANKKEAGRFTISLPDSQIKRYSHLYDNPVIKAMAERALEAARARAAPGAKVARRAHVSVTADRLEDMLTLLGQAGTPFYIESKHRGAAIAWLRENYQLDGAAAAPGADVEEPEELRPAA